MLNKPTLLNIVKTKRSLYRHVWSDDSYHG